MAYHYRKQLLIAIAGAVLGTAFFIMFVYAITVILFEEIQYRTGRKANIQDKPYPDD